MEGGGKGLCTLDFHCSSTRDHLNSKKKYSKVTDLLRVGWLKKLILNDSDRLALIWLFFILSSIQLRLCIVYSSQNFRVNSSRWTNVKPLQLLWQKILLLSKICIYMNTIKECMFMNWRMSRSNTPVCHSRHSDASQGQSWWQPFRSERTWSPVITWGVLTS